MRILCGTILAAAVALAVNGADFNVRDYGAKGDGAAKDTAALQSAIDVADPAATAARIVMDTNMNQFDPNPSRFESPAFQRECGFNAVALRMNGLPLAVTALYDGYDSRVFSEGSDARKWVLAVREQFAAKIREAKAAGLAVFVNTDVIVLPRRMKELYGDEICGPDGRIDFMKPKTLEIHRALIGEFFDTFPELDGIVVRTGETYTFKTPFHGGNGPCDYKNDLEGRARRADEPSAGGGLRQARKDVHLPHVGLRIFPCPARLLSRRRRTGAAP